MPKLSSQTIAKRFMCDQCASSFRTRQGLSGHIQFKHGPGAIPQVLVPLGGTASKKLVPDLNDLMHKRDKWQVAGATWMFSSEEIEDQKYILVKWPEVYGLCDAIGIKLDAADFKNYLVVALACAYLNEHLRKKLVSSFKQLHAKWMEEKSG